MLAKLKPMLKERWEPEALALGTRMAYLWCAHGISDSRLWTAVNRVIGDAGTARNLTTMTKLLALVDEREASEHRKAAEDVADFRVESCREANVLRRH